MSEPALRVSGVEKRFGATRALAGVDLEVAPGTVHAVIGENGAGKSTLMNVLAGAIRPDAGAMWLGGASYRPASPHDARSAGIALIHQELALCPHLTVAENILLGGEPRRVGPIFDRKAAERRAQELLDQFGHPELRPDRRVGDLSLAARQVVEICRALAANARVLLMDEPTSSFQRGDVDRLFALVRRLAASGIAVVYISHFLEEVREIATRYTVLRDGRTVDAGAIADVTNDRLVASMVGQPVAELFPSVARPPAGEVVLAVRGLSAPPGVVEASFELRRGEIFGIAGLMGSGRTELVRALFGLDRAAAGTIVVRGRDVPARGGEPSLRVREGFGYLSEDRKGEGLALPLSIADNVSATALRSFTGALGVLDLGRRDEAAAELIAELGIRARSPSQPVRALSGGNQQKVALGRLIQQDADVLLLDEPTRGIDVGSKAQIYQALSRLAAAGKGVIVVSSYLPELFGVCDRLAVMSRGRLSPARPTREWTAQSVLAAAVSGAA